jgi:hypothetical protein
MTNLVLVFSHFLLGAVKILEETVWPLTSRASNMWTKSGYHYHKAKASKFHFANDPFISRYIRMELTKEDQLT